MPIQNPSEMAQADANNARLSAFLNGAVPQTKFADAQYSLEGRGARYDLFSCTVEYAYDSGLLQCPAAAGEVLSDSTFALSGTHPDCAEPASVDRTPSVMVRVHAPVGRKIVRYFARRVGDRPLLPAPDCADSNLVLLSSRTVPEVPVLDESGALYVYATTVEYVYALLQPVTSEDGFAVGAAPFTDAASDDNDIEADDFVDDIA